MLLNNTVNKFHGISIYLILYFFFYFSKFSSLILLFSIVFSSMQSFYMILAANFALIVYLINTPLLIFYFEIHSYQSDRPYMMFDRLSIVNLTSLFMNFVKIVFSGAPLVNFINPVFR
jgi:hypothetical protein